MSFAWLTVASVSAVAAAVSAALTLVIAVVSYMGFSASTAVTRASQRDQAISNVVAAVERFKVSPATAPYLMLRLHGTARDVEEGLLTDEDVVFLGEYLLSEPDLKGRPPLCQAWSKLPQAIKAAPAFRGLIDKSLDPSKCNP